MDKARWPTGDGLHYEFDAYDASLTLNWNQVAGIYIFTFFDGSLWRALYIGQAKDFSDRLLNHERWSEAVRRGATHVHAKVVAHETTRTTLEQKLIEHCQPPMNQQLRSGLTTNPILTRLAELSRVRNSLNATAGLTFSPPPKLSDLARQFNNPLNTTTLPPPNLSGLSGLSRSSNPLNATAGLSSVGERILGRKSLSNLSPLNLSGL